MPNQHHLWYPVNELAYIGLFHLLEIAISAAFFLVILQYLSTSENT
jgi:hypothetical protein